MGLLWCIVILLMFTAVIHAESKTDMSNQVDGHCAVEVQKRIQCGLPGDTVQSCMNRGCCWTPCHGCPDVIPWCFIAHGNQYSSKMEYFLYQSNSPMSRAKAESKCLKNYDGLADIKTEKDISQITEDLTELEGGLNAAAAGAVDAISQSSENLAVSERGPHVEVWIAGGTNVEVNELIQFTDLLPLSDARHCVVLSNYLGTWNLYSKPCNHLPVLAICQIIEKISGEKIFYVYTALAPMSRAEADSQCHRYYDGLADIETEKDIAPTKIDLAALARRWPHKEIWIAGGTNVKAHKPIHLSDLLPPSEGRRCVVLSNYLGIWDMFAKPCNHLPSLAFCEKAVCPGAWCSEDDGSTSGSGSVEIVKL